jgi:hypothetical protein
MGPFSRKVPTALTHQEYERRLAVHKKAVCLEPYKNGTTKILHRCLIHGEIHLAIPRDVASGHGLACCGPQENRLNAKAQYDEKLSKIGLAIRIEEYYSRRTPILHRCIVHGKEYLQEPRRALEGRPPPCCSRLSSGSIYYMLLAPERWNKFVPCCVYIFSMARFKGLVKIGMAIKVKQRSEDSEYGDFISSWQRGNRFEAYLIEQAILKEPSLKSSAPEELKRGHWPGWTEIREATNPEAVKVAQYYVDEMDNLGVYRFILKYMNPDRVETDLCLAALEKSSTSRLA